MTSDVTEEISSGQELETWLLDKPAAWAQLIAYRIGLRMVPLAVGIKDWIEPANALGQSIAVFRALTASTAALRLRSPALSAENFAAAGRASDHYAGAADSATYAVDAAYYNLSNDGHANTAHAANNGARSATFYTSIPAQQTLFSEISRDCALLEIHEHWFELVDAPLWSEQYDWFFGSWREASRWLSRTEDNFAIWREWYYGRLEGLPHAFADFDDEADEKFYRWIIEQDDDWWKREPREVNADITAFVDALRISNQNQQGSEVTGAFEPQGGQLDFQSILDRLTAVETSTQTLAAEDIPELKAALQETREASLYALDEMDRPAIGHNSGAFEDVGPVDDLTFPVDAVGKIEEQLKAIDNRLLALQADLDKPQPTKGEVAKQGKGLAHSLDKMRKISPEFFKGLEAEFGKQLGKWSAFGLFLLVVKLSGLLSLIMAAVGG